MTQMEYGGNGPWLQRAVTTPIQDTTVKCVYPHSPRFGIEACGLYNGVGGYDDHAGIAMSAQVFGLEESHQHHEPVTTSFGGDCSLVNRDYARCQQYHGSCKVDAFPMRWMSSPHGGHTNGSLWLEFLFNSTMRIRFASPPGVIAIDKNISPTCVLIEPHRFKPDVPCPQGIGSMRVSLAMQNILGIDAELRGSVFNVGGGEQNVADRGGWCGEDINPCNRDFGPDVRSLGVCA